jgi:antitoxin component YwqK of YwqJK toxin-antitoxin module
VGLLLAFAGTAQAADPPAKKSRRIPMPAEALDLTPPVAPPPVEKSDAPKAPKAVAKTPASTSSPKSAAKPIAKAPPSSTSSPVVRPSPTVGKKSSPANAEPGEENSGRLRELVPDPPGEQIVISDGAVGPPREDLPPSGVEVVRERYPDGKPRLERYVVQDDAGNYVNHGLWTWYDPRGRVLGAGEFREGKRVGKWMRVFPPGEGTVFAAASFQQFKAPFVCTAYFDDDGNLDGVWTAHDSRGLLAFTWEFSHGDPNGKSVWYYPNGKRLREANYMQGVLEGAWLEWGPDNKLTTDAIYIQGQMLSRAVESYANGQPRMTGTYLHARQSTRLTFDFWEGRVDRKGSTTGGGKVRHGMFTWYHPNGAKQLEGNYQDDLATGVFTWWYPNGQKGLEGPYEDGKQHGQFTGWHPNGLKQMQVRYEFGQESGAKLQWNEQGQLVTNAPSPSRSKRGDAPSGGQPEPILVTPDAPPELAPPMPPPPVEESRTAQPSARTKRK